MSTILKALDRLDHEKGAENRERPLREEVSRRHAVPHSKGPSRRAFLTGVGAGVAILAIGLILFVSGTLTSSPDDVHTVVLPAPLAAVAAPGLSEPAPTAARVPRSVPEALPPERFRELSPSALGSDVAVIEPASWLVEMETPPPAPARAAERSGPPASPVFQRAPTPARKVQSRRSDELAQGSSKSESPQDRSLHSESLPEFLARATPAVTGDTASALPEVATAPIPEARVSIPVVEVPFPAVRDVRVARTIWHPTAERRFAFVEVSGQVGPLRVREGDAVGRLIVEKIEPWGVIFLDDGVEIRHRVGESH